ncbi:MAG: hypothetical protein IFNCLDLE_00154 [Ignavibacteriaceae bacterium]|nr:hypothetical protein [Ignavibacteriaceae bacterium]
MKRSYLTLTELLVFLSLCCFGETGNHLRKRNVRLLFLSLCCIPFAQLHPQTLLYENFDSAEKWKINSSDGVVVSTHSDNGFSGKGIRFDVNFTLGSGYGGIFDLVSLELPENYLISFFVKAKNLPPNNFEFKLIDPSGDNVWWVNRKGYDFPSEWTKITLRKRNLSFAWGPQGGGEIKNLGRIEFIVASANGGSGSVWIDELKIEKLDPPAQITSPPVVFVNGTPDTIASKVLFDNNLKTFWSTERLYGNGGSGNFNGADDDNNIPEKDGSGSCERIEGGEDTSQYNDGKKNRNDMGEVQNKTGNSNSLNDTCKKTELLIDLTAQKEFGGLVLDWNKDHFLAYFKVEASNDYSKTDWVSLFPESGTISPNENSTKPADGSIPPGGDFKTNSENEASKGNTSATCSGYAQGRGGKFYIITPEAQFRYIKITVIDHREGYSVLNEITFKELPFADNYNNLYYEVAADYPKGYFPRYTLKQQSYFTVVGVSGDTKEGLLSEDGALETDKQSFSVEPFIFANDKFYTWSDVKISHSLAENYLPVPSVNWRTDDFSFDITSFASGKPGASVLFSEYAITNQGKTPLKGKFFLALRPFQVNPPWQDLNFYGGTAKISDVSFNGKYAVVNNKTAVIPLVFSSPEKLKNELDEGIGAPTETSGISNETFGTTTESAGSTPESFCAAGETFGAAVFDEGDITSWLSGSKIPKARSIKDEKGLASGAFSYELNLKPGETARFSFAIPQYQNINPDSLFSVAQSLYEIEYNKTKQFWADKLSRIPWSVPKELETIFSSVKSNLGYILINRDGSGIQPGSRSYERSWIRDGALTSAALLKLGLKKEVKEFAKWYSQFLYPNGKVPCVVDKRGPDPVPENDANGEFIYLIYQYYRYTGDQEFVRELFPKVSLAVDYIREMIAQRSTSHYRDNPNDSIRSLYGLVPESISHEGYSDKPMHSYWDDFFTILGLKNAVTMAQLLGYNDVARSWAETRDSFTVNLYNSIRLAVRRTGIDYIPGCAEKGDFDPTSTTIAVYPCGEINNLPQPELDNTFKHYVQFFRDRRDGKIKWNEYTPYEMRTIGTFNFSGQTDIVWELIQFFMNDQRPNGWNLWAEVVTRDYRHPRFIGDMPHTWCGSDFINAIRAMVVHERESDNSLLIAPGFPDAWYEFDQGFSFKSLPTFYGELNYEIKKKGIEAVVYIDGDLKIPEGGIRYVVPQKFRRERIELNDVHTEPNENGEIIIRSLPATVELIYWK